MSELLRVSVVDRFRMAQDWGHGRGGIVTREVEIAALSRAAGAEVRNLPADGPATTAPGKQAP